MSGEPSPTFASRTDRVTYLLAQYKILITGLIIGVVALWIFYQPQVRLPPEFAAVTVGWIVFGIPCYLAGAKIARWLRRRNWEEVHEVDMRRDVIEKWYVPPQTWREKVVDGDPPHPVNDSSAWAVEQFEYLEDIGELRVDGVWLAGLESTKQYTAKSMLVDMHEWMLDQIEKLADLRARWSRGVVEMENKVVNSKAEAEERGITLDKTAAKEVFDSITDDTDDDIPGLDTEDQPEIGDYLSDGDQLERKIDEAREDQEAMVDG